MVRGLAPFASPLTRPTVPVETIGRRGGQLMSLNLNPGPGGPEAMLVRWRLGRTPGCRSLACEFVSRNYTVNLQQQKCTTVCPASARVLARVCLTPRPSESMNVG
jgi:hypothetical protein